MREEEIVGEALSHLLLVMLGSQLGMYSRELGMQVWTSRIYDTCLCMRKLRLGNIREYV